MLKYLSDKKNQPKPQNNTNIVPAKNKSPPLGGGHYTKISGMWNLKHDTSSPKIYEIIIKT